MSVILTNTKLAERTGVFAIDEIIASYKLRATFVDDMPRGFIRPLSDMRDPDLARNMCETVSDDFLTFAKQHPAIGDWEVFMLKDANSRLWGLDVCVDDDCGDPHTVVAFSNDINIHTVDFTAAQYDCELFPAVGALCVNDITGIRRSK
jgi:hypothetical protein